MLKQCYDPLWKHDTWYDASGENQDYLIRKIRLYNVESLESILYQRDPSLREIVAKFYSTDTSLFWMDNQMGDPVFSKDSKLHKAATVNPNWNVFKDCRYVNHIASAKQHNLFVWNPIHLGKASMEFSAYFSLVNRIQFLEFLIARYKSDGVLVQRLLEVQDRYQLLTITMEHKQAFSNDEICNCDGLNLMDTFYPSRQKVMCIQELPDMFVHLLYLKIWGKNATQISSFSDNPMIANVISFFSKFIPAPGKARSVTTILPMNWNEELFSLSSSIFVRLVFAELLGVYEHSKVKANYQMRQKLYKTFSLTPTSIMNDRIREWISTKKFYIVFCVRSFLFLLFKGMPAFNQFFADHYYWAEIKSNNLYPIDIVRDIFNAKSDTFMNCTDVVDFFDNNLSHVPYYQETRSHFENSMPDCDNLYPDPEFAAVMPGHDYFFGIPEYLSEANDKHLEICFKPIDVNWNQKIYKLFGEFDDKYYRNQDYQDEMEDVENKYGDEMVNIMALFPQHENVTYHWLAIYYKISLKSIMELSIAELIYKRDTPSYKLKQLFTKILERDVFDFMILRLFFIALYKKENLLVYNVPLDIYMKQMQTAHKIYMTKPGERIPDVAGLYRMCPNCDELKVVNLYHFEHPTDIKTKKMTQKEEMEYLQTKKKERLRSLCPERVVNDLELKKTFCGKNLCNTINLKKKVTQPAPYEAEGKILKSYQKKMSNKKKKNTLFNRCFDTPLKDINMIGRILHSSIVIGNSTEKSTKNSILCPYCLAMTIVHPKNIDPRTGVMSCGCQRVRNVDYYRCLFCSKITETPTHAMGFNDMSDPPHFQIFTSCELDSWVWTSGMLEHGVILSRIKSYFYVQQQNMIQKNLKTLTR